MIRKAVTILFVLAALYNISLYPDIAQRIQNAHEYSHETADTDIRTMGTGPKFFLIPTPEITTDLLLQQNVNATAYYQSALNEESAEVWLHRGFERMSSTHQTNDPAEADIFLIPAYFHLGRLNDQAKEYANQLVMQGRISNKTKPHVLLCPTWNPTTSRHAGITHFVQELQRHLGETHVWSVGFERNPSWQGVDATHIIPIPYVVRPSMSKQDFVEKTRFMSTRRRDNFVFYAGDARPNAVQWAGCNRSRMVTPLQNETNMDVSIRHRGSRLSQDEYNHRMFTSDYCLILCGDTVTSRSLTSAILYGCIPIMVGSRLRGLCEEPCHEGFGWHVTGPDCPHLPFPSDMEWQAYPEVNELNFSNAPLDALQEMFQSMPAQTKTRIRQNMQAHQLGWIYGWGDPVTFDEFGQAAHYVWRSILGAVGPLPVQ